ncbi:MAG: respiratory nitrate reductase subunit gamma [Desulfobacterales bacterium]|nr:respiratory nitrate reductase subunit gamma [Desulfobacterales bacterium]
MYDFIRGPFAWAALIIFVIGTIFQLVRYFSLSKKAGIVHYKTIPAQKTPESAVQLPFMARVKLTILGVSPVTVITSTVFHVLLIITPIFLVAHGVLTDVAWGFSIPAFSEGFSDFLTIVVMICGAYFLLRRIFSARVRAITTLYDYIIWVIAFAPFITGFMAYHHMFNYNVMITLHIFFGGLMLIAIPFTKLVHMFYFFINRFLMKSEHTFGKGSRTW